MKQNLVYIVPPLIFTILMLYYLVQDPGQEPIGVRMANIYPTFLACMTFIWGINQQLSKPKE